MNNNIPLSILVNIEFVTLKILVRVMKLVNFFHFHSFFFFLFMFLKEESILSLFYFYLIRWCIYMSNMFNVLSINIILYSYKKDIGPLLCIIPFKLLLNYYNKLETLHILFRLRIYIP